jgi:hypothetical protein
MSKWAQAKQLIDLDWRTEWRTIADRLAGEQPAAVVGLVLAMDQAYHRRDKAEFLALKAQLVKQPSWSGSSDSFNDNPPVGSAKPTAVATQLDCLI